MPITNSNTTGNIIQSVWNTLEVVLGTEYTNTYIGNKTITYKEGKPRAYTGYTDDFPIIFLNYKTRIRPEQVEQGGKRDYGHLLNVHVIAGGYDNELQNELMKHDLMDRIVYGFDNKEFNYIIKETNAVEGRYKSQATEVARITTDFSDEFEKHHGVIEVNATIQVKNN